VAEAGVPGFGRGGLRPAAALTGSKTVSPVRVTSPGRAVRKSKTKPSVPSAPHRQALASAVVAAPAGWPSSGPVGSSTHSRMAIWAASPRRWPSRMMRV